MSSLHNNRRPSSRKNLVTLLSSITRVCFYCRVSTEEQAERETVRNQVEFLNSKFRANFEPDSPEPMQLVGTFVDEGWSGALPLEERPEGRRMLQLVANKEVDLVIVLRLDRLARKLRILLETYEQFEMAGVAFMSATEPFDTRISVGKFMFNLLGSMAELERDTIRDRMSLGRDRMGRDGRYITGVVPLGYTVVDSMLVPSERMIPQLGMHEADLARTIFQKVAEGESAAGVGDWLTAMGVPSQKIWGGKSGTTVTEERVYWPGNRLQRMIRSTIYYGKRTLHHASGDIEQDVPALVEKHVWDLANLNMSRGRSKGGHKPVKWTYLLTGRVWCGECGAAMVGNFQGQGRRLYYGCGRAPGKAGARRRSQPCTGIGYANGHRLEEFVLDEIDGFVLDPDTTLNRMRERFLERYTELAKTDAFNEQLRTRLQEAEQGKSVIMTLARRGRITPEDADRELAIIAEEAAAVRLQIETLNNKSELARSMEHHLQQAQETIHKIKNKWLTARDTDDRPTLRQIVQDLISEIKVHADGKVTILSWMGNPSAPHAQSFLWAEGVDISAVWSREFVLKGAQ